MSAVRAAAGVDLHIDYSANGHRTRTRNVSGLGVLNATQTGDGAVTSRLTNLRGDVVVAYDAGAGRRGFSHIGNGLGLGLFGKAVRGITLPVGCVRNGAAERLFAVTIATF